MAKVDEAMKYVNSINSPYLGVYPDVGNLTNASRIYKVAIEKDIHEANGHCQQRQGRSFENFKKRNALSFRKINNSSAKISYAQASTNGPAILFIFSIGKSHIVPVNKAAIFTVISQPIFSGSSNSCPCNCRTKPPNANRKCHLCTLS
jgi:hypothetical protein